MRDKLIEIISSECADVLMSCADECDNCPSENCIGCLADRLIAHGVTLATDNNDGDKWIDVTKRLPKPFISVLVQMPGEKPFPTVREGFLTGEGKWYAGYFTREPEEVTHWRLMPEAPKEVE